MENLLDQAKGIFTKQDGKLNWGAIGIGAGSLLLGGWLGSAIGGGGIFMTIIGALVGLFGGSMLSQAVLGARKTEEETAIQKVKGKQRTRAVDGKEYEVEVAGAELKRPWNLAPDEYVKDMNQTGRDFVERVTTSKLPPETLAAEYANKKQAFYDYVGTAYDLSAQKTDPALPKIDALVLSDDLQKIAIARTKTAPEKWQSLNDAEKLKKIAYANSKKLEELTVELNGDASAVQELRDQRNPSSGFFSPTKGLLTATMPGVGLTLGGISLAGKLARMGIDFVSPSGLKGAQDEVEDYLASGSKVTDEQFKKNMRELAMRESKNKKDGAKAAETIDAWAVDIVDYRNELRSRDTIEKLQITAGKNADKFLSALTKYTEQHAATTSPARDEASFKAALAQNTTPLVALNTDGKDHEEAAHGTTAAKPKRTVAVPTTPTGEISTAGLGTGVSAGQGQ